MGNDGVGIGITKRGGFDRHYPVPTTFRSVSGFTVRDSVLEYGSTFVLSNFAKTSVTFVHLLARKLERAGNLHPILIYITPTFEYREQE